MRIAGISGIRTGLLKALLFVTIIMFVAGTVFSERETVTECAGVKISFVYQHASTMASNQLAVWIENEEGALVRTLMATDFTAGRRGYRNREAALPAWVEAADPESMTDQEIDAVSCATPIQGPLTYVWDLTNDLGEPVPAGIYLIRVEGTLYWESDTVYTAVVDLAEPADEIPLSVERTAPDAHENENMISEVTVRAFR